MTTPTRHAYDARYHGNRRAWRRFLGRGGLCLLTGALATAAEPVAPPDLALLQALPIADGKVVSAEYEAEDSAKHLEMGRTKLKIVLTPATGSHINVEVWLPEAGRWNGRFIGLGNGGAAGKINPGSLAGASAGGSAVATTDMGTAPNADSGIGNREVWKDFGYRATHLMTVVGKQVVTACYGKAPTFSYFNGGSTGGQQALQEAQRYPEDYDGIVANIPAHCRTPLHAYFLWNDQILKRCLFSKEQQQGIIHAGNDYMATRELPQTAGKLVSDPRCTKDDIAAVVALARKNDPSLTDAHAEALRQLFDGPRHAITGERIFDGIPFGATFDIARGNLYLFNWVFGKDKDLMTVDWAKDIDTYTAALGPLLNAENADLERFEKRGGKLLMISGSADSCVPYHASLDYYERVVEHCGSLERARSFIRFYIIPGMSHGPGPGINKLPGMLDLVIGWREQGAVPGKIQGQRIIDGRTELDLPLYPYPTRTGWIDGGYAPVDGPRGGVDRVAERFRPAATE